jgi:hypothetical protein
MEKIKIAYSIFVGKPEGKRRLGRHRHRWEDNIRMDIRGIEWEVVDLMCLDQDRDQWRRLVNTVMNLIKSSRAISRVRCT